MLSVIFARWRELLAAAAIVSIVVLYQMNDAKGARIKKQNAVLQAQQNVASLDKNFYQEWQDEKGKNDRLRAGVANGSVGLRVRATCPTTTPGVVDAAAAELDGVVRPTYYALREAITQSDAQIKGLQALVKQQDKLIQELTK